MGDESEGLVRPPKTYPNHRNLRSCLEPERESRVDRFSAGSEDASTSGGWRMTPDEPEPESSEQLFMNRAKARRWKRYAPGKKRGGG